MATFTVFAFGTGDRSTMKRKNILSQFSEHCSGEHAIIEGPGILGKEVQQNVRKQTDEIILWLNKQQDFKNTINLTGFSRGSVTCIRIANQLKRYEDVLIKKQKQETLNPKEKKLLIRLEALQIPLEDLPKRLHALNINIFASDPVAGLKDKRFTMARVIPSNVKSYVAFLQMDERRRDFKPQDMSRIILAAPETTQVSLLPMYGNHTDSTRIRHKNMQCGPKLAWYTLYQFLTQHGTTFKGDKLPQIVTLNQEFFNLPENPTSKDLLTLFAKYHLERDEYSNSGKAVNLVDGLPIPRKLRSFNKQLKFYVKNSDFFVNQLERELFKISYPKVFNYLFERNQLDLRFPNASKCGKQEVADELIVLKKENPDLFARLKKFDINESKQSITLGEPSGIYYLEPCASLQQIFPAMVPKSVRDNAKEMNLLATLELEIYHLTFRYARDKSEFSPFTPRALANYAQDIRIQVNNIIDNTTGDSNTKYNKVLDNIERHFLRLIHSMNGNVLSMMLEKLLEKHGRCYHMVTESLPRNLLANCVRITLDLLKEVISFIGRLGYIDGILVSLGLFLEDFGQRCNELLGSLGYNPFKYVFSVLAYTFEGIGYLLTNTFGLRPLTRFICDCINHIKNEIVIAIGGIKVHKISKFRDIEVLGTCSSEVPELSDSDTARSINSSELSRASVSEVPGVSDSEDSVVGQISASHKVSSIGLFTHKKEWTVPQDDPIESISFIL